MTFADWIRSSSFHEKVKPVYIKPHAVFTHKLTKVSNENEIF